MKTKILIFLIVCILHPICALAQGGFPWNNPLKMAWSTDGKIFNPPQIFQDSSGVPCVIRWNGDTLIAAFQWFRQPNPSPSWDRVATKFSYDNGLTWTQPKPIVINGLPANYQRAFDPTLTIFKKDSIRIYFSSSKGTPMGGLDSTINTYSAKSIDGINFYFEPNARVDQQLNKVIDPAVIYFNTGWHYLAPIGSPQQGAYHYVSPDGLHFSAVQNIPSDNSHNWTGNYMIESNSELRFYGSGPTIWYNYSPNGGVWSGYVNTNLQGGDPSVLKISSNNYLIVYVGPPYSTGISGMEADLNNITVFPNPASDKITVIVPKDLVGSSYTIYDQVGKLITTGKIHFLETSIDVSAFHSGIYLLSVGETLKQTFKVLKQ